MKKILAIVCSLFTMYSAGGCGGSDTKQNAETDAIPTEIESTTSTEIEKTYIIGEEEIESGSGESIFTYEYKFIGEEIISGKVYIVMPQNLKYAESELNIAEHDFVVVDYRNHSDPNVQIRTSYRANNPDIRKCVLDILLKYEENHPSQWERTYKSMNSEWYMHNMSYFAGYSIDHSEHVDLNNNDEIKYKE